MNKSNFYYNKILSGSNTQKDSKDSLNALKMVNKPCPGDLTNHPATQYLSVSHFYKLTKYFYTN